jgi:hypothetical protein
MIYPAFGIVFAKGIEAFSLPDASDRRFQGDRTALWFVSSRVSVTAALRSIQVLHHFHHRDYSDRGAELSVLFRSCVVGLQVAIAQLQGYSEARW